MLDESMRLHYSELKNDEGFEVMESEPIMKSVIVKIELKGMMFIGAFEPEGEYSCFSYFNFE